MTLYAITLLSWTMGTGFALYQNWQVRMAAHKTNLVRIASTGNWLMENALVNAGKVLSVTQTQLETALQKGPLSQAAIHQLLKVSSGVFSRYNANEELGLMFFVTPQGLVYARSDVLLTRPIDMTDRFYYTDLRDHPEKISTVGPLLRGRTHEKWVFHMAMPVHDAQGQWAGVLVQQLLASAMALDLAAHTDTDSFELLTTQLSDHPVSFVYPPPNDAHDDARAASALVYLNAPITRKNGTHPWERSQGPVSEKMLMGYAQSSLLGLTSDVSLPMSRVWQLFIEGNLFLLIYACAGVSVVSAMFFYLYRLSHQLINAQTDSRHDALTGLHNRRALDEQLPLLLRQSQREQSPLAVLFIDIDHFRLFNEHYGHESGDVALQAVANALASVCQRPRDLICRWGGEEFVAVLPRTDAQAAAHMAQHMLRVVRSLRLHVARHRPPPLTVSIGFISATVLAANADNDLIAAADQAMQQAKHQGRNQSVMAKAIHHLHNTRMTCVSK